MKLLEQFKQQLADFGDISKVWLTTFNISIDFIETFILPAVLGMDAPRNRMDYEAFQLELAQRGIDFRVFCDKRMLGADQNKRTAIHVHPVSPRGFADMNWISDDTLFHPKVIYLENREGDVVLGAGSANLTLSGWGRNQEVFDFRALSNNAQYQQIKRFFGTLAAEMDIALDLPIKRKFGGSDDSWRFVHSFEEDTLLDVLFGEGDAEQLTVWSPYLAEDLPAFIARLLEYTDNPALKIALVPDRIEGRYIRTPWRTSLGKLLQDGSLSFYTNPTPRHDNVEMTHAKVWQASGKRTSMLAIGSWNFTTPGSASFAADDGAPDIVCNIEAGIVHACEPRVKIAGNRIDVGEGDFASAQMLEDDALDLPEQLPFDLVVRFDWHSACYHVTGQWEEGEPNTGYRLKLPAMRDAIDLVWKSRRQTGKRHLEPIQCDVADSEPLLAEHYYTVEREGKPPYHGLIIEEGQAWRRAQSFDSLKDLLDSLITQTDAATSDNLVLRECLRNGAGPDEDLPVAAGANDRDSLTYFRLFQAVEQFRQRLLQTQTLEQLDKWLFVYPGCLQELASKVQQQISSSPPQVFNWFLAQEVNSLHAAAVQQYADVRERSDLKQPPAHLWNALRVPLPPLPPEVAGKQDYLNLIKAECAYGHG